MALDIAERAVPVDLSEIRQSERYISENLKGHFISWDCFRFCLEIYHRALFKPAAVVSPSLELGIGDGFSSWFMHRDKPEIDYGADLPFGATLESCGMNVAVEHEHYKQKIGMDMSEIPFPDNSFASIFSSHTMFYGQDLQKTFDEIMRVLAPGGKCVYACDLDEWFQYKSLIDWIREPDRIPSIKLYPKEHHIELLKKSGATNIQYRTFFQSSLEAVTQGLLNKMPAGIRGMLASESGKQTEIDEWAAMMYDIFCTIIEKELSAPNGPENAFNVFMTFEKPGVLPTDLPVPAPVCVVCHNTIESKSITQKACSCGESYAVHAGIPMMIRSNHPGYSPTPIRQKAAELSNRADRLLSQVLPKLAPGPYYVINGGASPVPGYTALSILAAAMQFTNQKIAGIVADLPLTKQWQGHPIVSTNAVPKSSHVVLFTASEGDCDHWVSTLKQDGFSGTVSCIAWSEQSEPTVKKFQF